MSDFQSTPWDETYDRESWLGVDRQIWDLRVDAYDADEGVLLTSDEEVRSKWDGEQEKTLAYVKEWFRSVHGYTGELVPGKRANGLSCVIHNTLAARYGEDRIRSVCSVTYEIYNKEVQGFEQRIVPPIITKFVRMFDSKLFPELEVDA